MLIRVSSIIRIGIFLSKQCSGGFGAITSKVSSSAVARMSTGMRPGKVDPQLRFDGRVAVVTGAGGGLGRTYALLLAKRGASVVVNDLGGTTQGQGSDVRAADAVVAEIRKAGDTAVSDYHSVTDGDAIMEGAIKQFGRVDVLVCNAGILRDTSFAKMDDASWNAVLQVCCARLPPMP